MTRAKRLAKTLGKKELARRLHTSQKRVENLLRRPTKDPKWQEALRTVERRHKAAKVARASQKKPAKPRWEPLQKPRRKEVVRAGRDQRQAIRESLEHLQKTFIKATIKTHVYKSGQVRAEFRVKVPKKRTVRDMLLEISEESTFKPGVWVSVGFTFHARAGMRANYPLKNMGKERVNVSPQKKKKLPENILTGATIAKNIQRRHGKPDEVILRVAWNPSGKQESFRRGRRKKKKGRRK
jgi:hypothetical protein